MFNHVCIISKEIEREDLKQEIEYLASSRIFLQYEILYFSN